jgi:hypothetical protein
MNSITLLSEAHTELTRSIRRGNKDAIRKARAWEAECWEAAMIVRLYQQRVLLRQDAGITARQRLNALRNDITDYIDIKMMRTP